jgi:hypothetical protein
MLFMPKDALIDEQCHTEKKDSLNINIKKVLMHKKLIDSNAHKTFPTVPFSWPAT